MINCELLESPLTDALIDELVTCSKLLFNVAPDRLYISKLNQYISPLALIARNKEGSIIGFKLGYAQSDDVFYSWLGGVHPQYRNIGVASEMIEAQHGWCKQKNFSMIRTKSHKDNQTMYALNHKHGFHVIGFDYSILHGARLIFSKNFYS
jgi:predicted GNAT superfamily acetyltransferase